MPCCLRCYAACTCVTCSYPLACYPLRHLSFSAVDRSIDASLCTSARFSLFSCLVLPAFMRSYCRCLAPSLNGTCIITTNFCCSSPSLLFVQLLVILFKSAIAPVMFGLTAQDLEPQSFPRSLESRLRFSSSCTASFQIRG